MTLLESVAPCESCSWFDTGCVVYDVDVPPPPAGPRPAAFSWPYELAERALRAMQAELDELSTCARSHDTAADAACATWQGASRTGFVANLGAALQDISAEQRLLADDMAELEAAVEAARRAEERRGQEIARWDRQMSEHRRAQSRQWTDGVRPR